MATAPINATADTLEALTRDLHELVFDYREPARSHHVVEQRIARGEDIASRIRAAVRGRT